MKRGTFLLILMGMMLMLMGCDGIISPDFTAAIYENGTVIYEHSGEETEDSVYELASNGKVVTAYIALKLVQNGEIGLEDPIYPHLDPNLQTGDARLKEVTLRQLLCHTAGFSPSYELGIDKKLYADPGREFCYSGVSYIYLQSVVENVTERSLEEAAEEYVFSPLGMEHSSFEKGKTVTPHMSLSNVVLYAFAVFILSFLILFLIAFAAAKITKNRYYSMKTGFLVSYALAGIVNTVFLLAIPNLSKVLYVFGIFFAIGGVLLCISRKTGKLFYPCIPALLILILALGFTIPSELPVTSDLIPRKANAAYSFRSTARDMGLFCLELLAEYQSGSLIGKEMFSEYAWIDEQNSWGAGLAIEKGAEGRTYWHSGINPGFQSLLVIDPEEEKFAVILTCSDHGLNAAVNRTNDILKMEGRWEIPRGRISLE